MLRAKGSDLGRVEDPTTAKFAPFENVGPSDSKYGLSKLAFRLWPAQTIMLSLHYTIAKHTTDIKCAKELVKRYDIIYLLSHTKGLFSVMDLRAEPVTPKI